ncbi:MAG TPA: hypothetical protein VH740_20200 [Vicinamibacterales bacterium]|jgi:hypothetical protein
MNVTRHVIGDLWALASAGEASEDSRRLIDEYLAADPELARQLRAESSTIPKEVPMRLPHTHEIDTLRRTKKALRRRSPMRLVAIALWGLALARFLEQTSPAAIPPNVVATAILAAVFTAAAAVHTYWMHNKTLAGR